MQQLSKVLTQTTWANASDTINKNSDRIYEAITQVENATTKHKGYFNSIEDLNSAFPTPRTGWIAYVYNTENSSEEPYDIYTPLFDSATSTYVWVDSGNNTTSPQVDIDGINSHFDAIEQSIEEQKGEVEQLKTDMEVIPALQTQMYYKQDKLNSYVEAVVDGIVEQVAIMGDSEGNTTSVNINPIVSEINMNVYTSDGNLANVNVNEFSAGLSYTNNQGEISHLSVNDGEVDIRADSINIGDNTTIEVDNNQDGIKLHTKDNASMMRMRSSTIQFFASTMDLSQVTTIPIGNRTNLSDLIPYGVTQQEVEAMKANNTWDEFLNSHALVYVYEQ